MTDDEQRAILWMGLTLLPIEVQEKIGQLIAQGKSPEQGVSALLVGQCPNCGSENTQDDDDAMVMGVDPGDTTVGVCGDCGYLWCLECGEALTKWPCPHWDEWSEFCKTNGVDEEDDEEYYEWLESKSENA